MEWGSQKKPLLYLRWSADMSGEVWQTGVVESFCIFFLSGSWDLVAQWHALMGEVEAQEGSARDQAQLSAGWGCGEFSSVFAKSTDPPARLPELWTEPTKMQLGKLQGK